MISFIVVSHGHDSDVEKLICSILSYCNINSQLILIDNLGGAFFNSLAHKYGLEDFILVSNISPKSFSENNNIGASLAKHNILVFLNPDTTLIDQSLKEFVKKKKKIPKGLFYPRLVNEDGSVQVHGKSKPNMLDQLITFLCSLSGIQRESPAGDYWFYAAAIICDNEFFREIGGFDEYFPMYAEDVELCDRVRKQNHPVRIQNDVVLMHKLGGDSKGKYIWKAVISNIYLRYKMAINSAKYG